MTVDVLNESGVDDVDVAALTSLCRFVMRRMRLHPQTEMTLRLVDVDTIAVLNEQWMGKKGPTDVLSFPMDELRPPDDDEPPEPGILGDVVLCAAVAERQAVAAGHSTADELHLLTTHGILHLLGYDHAEPDEEREMFGLQADLLSAWSSSPAHGPR